MPAILDARVVPLGISYLSLMLIDIDSSPCSLSLRNRSMFN